MVCCSTKRKKKQVQAVVPIVIGPDGAPLVLPEVVQPEVVQPDEFEPTCCERIIKCCHKKETVKAINQFSKDYLLSYKCHKKVSYFLSQTYLLKLNLHSFSNF
jgi:hypothetical protein